MKRLMNLLMSGLGACLAVLPAGAGEPSFAAKPGTAAEAEGVRIRFAVTAPCDAEVAVLNGAGAEVRHLAAGLVGAEKAAEPLEPGKLEQALLWDRKDDRGRPVTGQGFKVRVRLGMKAAGARPILKAKTGKSTDTIEGIDLAPDPAEAGRPGITGPELETAEAKALKKRWGLGWMLMADREDDRLYATKAGHGVGYRYLGATGKVEPRSLPSMVGNQVGPDGEIHVHPFLKFTRDLQQVPPPAGALDRSLCNRFDFQFFARSRATPFNEWWNTVGGPRQPGLDGKYYIFTTASIPLARFYVFDTWENKRALLREGFQPWLSYSSHGAGHIFCLRIDKRGKVYAAAVGAPKDVKLPDVLKCGEYPFLSYGSIVRLNLDERWAEDIPLPMGGAPKDPGELKRGVMWSTDIFMPRLDRCYPGVMSWLWGGCACQGSTFDIDEYSRMYVPDAGRESVVVLDDAGNEVLRLGKTVAAGPEGKGAAINVGWPHRVACSRRAVYFGEDLSMRVIRVGLGYAAEEICDVK